MANEFHLAITANYSKNSISAAFSDQSFQCNVTGNGLAARTDYSAPTVDTDIPLDGVATPRWLVAKNLSASNYVDIKDAVGGNVIARLSPGFPCVIPLPNGCVAPSMQANTAACVVQYRIIPG